MPLWKLIRDSSNTQFSHHSVLAHGKAADSLVFIWSLCEAVFWFVLPDFLLIPLVILAPTRARRLVTLAVTGSLCGAITMMVLSYAQPTWVAVWLFQLPFTNGEMPDKIHHLQHSYGIWSILWQPVSAVPLKVWIYDATVMTHWPPLAFLGLVAIARAIRMTMLAFIAYFLVKRFFNTLKAFWLLWLGLYTLVFFLGLWLSSR